MRCSACNKLLSDDILMMSKEIEGKLVYEDLCHKCRSSSHSKYSFVIDHEYVHQGISIYGDLHKLFENNDN